MKNNSFFIYLKKPKKTLNLKYNDEIALICIFETGIKCQFINENSLIGNEDLVKIDIDKTMYFPSIDADIKKVKTYILNKNAMEIELFFKRIINIASDQIWSSRVLDFVLLIEKHLQDNIFFVLFAA